MGALRADEEDYSNSQVEPKERLKYDKRSFKDVLLTTLKEILYFFTPFVIVHNVGWWMKPLVTDDPRGPWEMLWNRVVDRIGEDRYLAFVLGQTLVVLVVYWTVALVFTVMDFTQRPKFLRKYKIQPGKNEPVDWVKFSRSAVVVLFNLLMALPGCVLVFRVWDWRSHPDIRHVPTTRETFGTLLVCMLCHDALFYHFHRILHHRWFYKRIHKMHHEWQAPVAAAALYAHPFENFLTGLVSPVAGTVLTAAPLPVAWLWLSWIIVQIQNDHSGYHFPLVFSPEMHDYHHFKFHTCYGWMGFWDWFYGTDIAFQKTGVIKDRHFRIHSTKSAREIVPDDRGN